MARNPYGKRIAQGAAQGALGAGTAGFALGGPVGGLVGLGVGGLAGGLMARPGDDEERLRARMRKLEMGVLGNEATAIRQRFMNPVRGAAQEQEVRRRALEQGTALSGAAARRGQAAQRAARGDIAEAGQEATLAVMDLGERRRQQAQRINESLLRGEELRDRAFRQNMFNQGLRAAGEIGSVLGEKTAYTGTERAVLPIAASNAADLQAIASEDPMFDPAVSDPLLPEAADTVPTTPSPVKVPGLGEYAVRAEAERQARARLEAVDQPPVEAADQPPVEAVVTPDPDLAARMFRKTTPMDVLLGESVDADRQQALDYVIADEARQLEAEGRAADYAYDPDYRDLRKAYPGFTPADVADMFELYREMDSSQKAKSIRDYGVFLDVAQGL